jgi:hypothetical protein
VAGWGPILVNPRRHFFTFQVSLFGDSLHYETFIGGRY